MTAEKGSAVSNVTKVSANHAYRFALNTVTTEKWAISDEPHGQTRGCKKSNFNGRLYGGTCTSTSHLNKFP